MFCDSRAIGDSWEELKERFRHGTEDHQTTIASLETQALQPLKRTVVGELEGKYKQVKYPSVIRPVVHTYVCMYVRMYLRMYLRIYYVHMYICAYIRMYVCMYVCV